MKTIFPLLIIFLGLSACSITVKQESHVMDKNSLICSAGYPLEELAKNTQAYQSYVDCVTQMDKRDKQETQK